MASQNVTPLAQQALNLRCLALTGSFETGSLPPGCFGCIAGDFDGQGISYSALQWNLGQGTLQPLLSEMNTAHPDVMNRVFGDDYAQFCKVLSLARNQQLDWARSVQNPQYMLDPQWKQRFRALGEFDEFQAVAVRHASQRFEAGLALCQGLGLKSQRAAALMFDIEVQNGGIGPVTRALIERDFAALLPADPDVQEVARMRAVAGRIADASSARWRDAVRSRKLTIADGTGIVNGAHYDLAAQFGLTMAPSLS